MSFFKRPATHYGKTPEPETPYQRAAQIWDGYRARLMADPFAPLDPARTSNSSGNDGGFHANE